MPFLNDDILLDIIADIEVAYCGNEKIDALTKFMLSGKEPLKATLKYFSRADRVAFNATTMDVHGKNWSFYCIPYEFGLLQPILRILIKNVIKIVINEYQTIEGLSILEQFICCKKLKEVKIWNCLPEKHMSLLQQLKLDKIAAVNFVFRSTNQEILYNFLMIPSAIHELNSHMYDKFSPEQIFDKVEMLRIGHCTNNKQLNQIFEFLSSSSFPNLKRIEANFHHFGFLSKNWLSAISKKIKGKICVTVSCWQPEVKEQVLEEYGFDKKLKISKKTFDIHDGLIVEISIL